MATKDYAVTFTPHDATSTGAGEMGYEIRTAAGGGGATLTSGTCTSGTPVTTATFNDPTLVPAPGVNHRYIRTRDGAGNWTDTLFNVIYVLPTTEAWAMGGVGTITSLDAAVFAALSGVPGWADIFVEQAVAKPTFIWNGASTDWTTLAHWGEVGYGP